MTPQAKAAMLAAFNDFTTRITAEYNKAAEALLMDNYAEAQKILSKLAQSHAKTSLSLRNMLVKEGLLEE